MEFNYTSSSPAQPLHNIINILISSLVEIPFSSFFNRCCELLMSVQSSVDGKSANTITGTEVSIVLAKMDIELSHSSVHDHEQVKQLMAYDDFSTLFEEEEPSVDEVKKAFSVFDENNDGFIDAEDLQRVLLKLGFVEKLQLDDCKQMIKVYDGNCDGKINFMEFSKLTEISLY